MTIKVLVTGSEGQLAHSLAERAVRHPDIELLCTSRSRLDLELPQTIEAAVRELAPAVVISAGAYTAVDRAEDEPDLAMRVNRDGPEVLARATRAIGAALIHISTDYVYDGRKNESYVEGDPTGPQSVYGHSKLAGEVLVHAAHPEAVILRTSWIYSPFGRNFVRTMLDLAKSRDRLTVVDDQYGNPTSALDLADALLHMIQRWRADPSIGLGGLYHCSGSGETSWCGLARHVMDISRSQGGPFADVAAIGTDDWPTKARRPANSRLDCNKFARDFSRRLPDWRPSVAEVVSRLLAEASPQQRKGCEPDRSSSAITQSPEVTP
jgi:dTDP-4-dehydrorhamnose reductase